MAFFALATCNRIQRRLRRHRDWSRFEHLPLFKAVNRMNAYNTYLLMEQQAGGDVPAPGGAR